MALVAKFRIDSIAGLARQMPFTPGETRAAQVAAAEELLHEIDPDKAYPLDYVVHRITGYRPKQPGDDLLTGLALQHDLGQLIEDVSDTLDVRTADLAEPVLTIEDVTEKFSVTSKTIQRWRRRGLPARRFVFPDGKRRVGFLLGSVERFFAAHQDQVARGTNFSQVNDAEREEILRRARRLAALCGCCEREVARRVGRKMNRSPATVLHTVRKHDREHPEQAVFAHAPRELNEAERLKILRGYRRGISLKSLARRNCRPRATVYRVIVEETIARLEKRKVKFIDDPLYHEPDADTAIAAILSQQDVIDTAKATSARPEEARVPRDLPPYLQALYRTPLLSPARERALFLAFNYHKCRFVTARRRLDPQSARARDLNEMEAHLRRATALKNQIVQANLRLVVSVARKHLRPGLSMMELVSEGNLTLMRAVEGFDVHRGHRFSTYATLALMKGFARAVPQMLAARRAAGGGSDADALSRVPDRRLASAGERFLDREEVGALLSRLSDRERTVLRAHYGLGESQDAPATYEQLARRLGLSKQRVRQIEQSALTKLRQAVGIGPTVSVQD